MHRRGNFGSNSARAMKFGSFYGGEDHEHSGVRLVKITYVHVRSFGIVSFS